MDRHEFSDCAGQAPVETDPVRFLVGNDAPGAPLLHLDLLIEVLAGRITGHARITQAVEPPNDVIRIDHLTGTIREFTPPPDNRVVSLAGSYMVPSAEIVLSFAATLVVDSDSTGRGTFSYGSHVVTDVPVRPR